MGLKKQKGAILVTLVIAMTLMAVLGAGIYSLTTSSSIGELLANQNDNAYDLARAGIRYDIQNASGFGNNFPSTTFYMPDANHTFTISIVSGVITSTGVVNAGTFLEARRVIVVDLTALGFTAPGNTINFASDFSSFGSPNVSNPSAPANQQAIQANTSTDTINIGGGTNDASGALWYQGSSSAGNCVNGICPFSYGLRAYFEFTSAADWDINSTSSADGFDFVVMSAVNNTRTTAGGAAPGVSQGELMGYAGPDSTGDNLGIKPPKMAIEFDTYPNTGTGDICSSNSRSDPSPFANHMALMFWGARAISAACCSTYSKSSYDDNRHSAGGSGGDP
ncbi:MAG: hypothetical protein L7F78_11685, partial [Syntrophales bacterium LBB04]|nr:hypothetical protein [Syntrophales bacterium LBB04]